MIRTPKRIDQISAKLSTRPRQNNPHFLISPNHADFVFEKFTAS